MSSEQASSARFSQLADWLAWQETLHPKAIDMGLERVREVARRLDAQLGGMLLGQHTEDRVNRVLVAGTNGKGSCIASMDTLLRSQGLCVGCYTSPHLISYNERICINGQPVSDAALCNAFAAIDLARGEISLSYFEFGTLAAYWLMAQAQLDIWLIEVGLGGRLDATNIIDADIAIITSIDLDHEAFLGDTRELIALEKLGIARPDRLLICADLNPPQSLLDGVAKLNCPVAWAGEDFYWQQNEGVTAFVFGDELHFSAPTPQLPLPSVAAALLACLRLGQLPPMPSLVDTVSQLRLAGRWHRLSCQGVDVVLDVAHNPASTQALGIYLQGLARSFVLLMGMMADKNIPGSLAPLTAAGHLFAISLPLPRAATPEALAAQAQELGFVSSAWNDVQLAIASALARCKDTGEMLVICGSFYTLAQAYPVLHALGACEVKRG